MSADFTGIWHADLSRSKLLGPIPQAMTVRIAHSDPDLRQEIWVTKSDGSVESTYFQCRTTGEEGHCLLNGNLLRGVARWQGEELVIELWIQQGELEVYLCDCWSLSPDGQTLRMEHRNDALAGQVAILERAA